MAISEVFPCTAAEMAMASACASGERSAAHAPARTSGRSSARTTRERRWARLADALRGAALVAALIVLPARAITAQSIIDRLQLDRLQLVSLGLGFGSIAPSQVDRTQVFGLAADYGELSPAWRLQFRITYWESKFQQKVIDEFADTLQQSLTDPTATTVVRSPISLYDAAFGLGARRLLIPAADVTPFFTMGFAGHVINAEGDFIKGTFVERALDDIAVGVFGDVGFRARILRRLLVEGSVRGDLLSGFRSVQWMATASYYFGEARRDE
jgi:hypothetical protein